MDASDGKASEHLVQFYETEAFLVSSLNAFVAAGLRAREAVIVVARPAIRDALEEQLESEGFRLDDLRASGGYLALDAAATLSTFMVDGTPDPARFGDSIGQALARVSDGGRRIRVFGEMVALLWTEGSREAAIRLEGLWNDLRRTRPFVLLCAYALDGFDGRAHSDMLRDVCGQHSRVLAAESYSALHTADDRLRAVIALQQKARSLQAEVEERRRAEEALRAVKAELELQVDDLRRLHEMSAALTSTLEIDSVLEEVLRAALAVQGTDMGLLSLCDLERGGLVLKAHSGFDQRFLREVDVVPAGAGAGGACFAERRRVVVEDVDVDPVFAPYRAAAQTAGFRAVHSTPLIGRDGNIIGVLSAHFRARRRPSQREMRLMDLYARMAADMIENARLHHRLHEELSAREQLLARERLARAEAETANRMKDEFLATVSHELRTPLNAIIGWSHMLREGRLDEATAARALATIDRNARSQARLVEDILDVSRMIMGKLRIKVEPIDLAAVDNAAIDSVQLAADARGIRLEVRLDPSARRVAGDFSRLQQVVWNLLSNAIKFTPAGGRVEVRLDRADPDVEISVSDTGQGIGAEFLPFIFERFRQADGTSSRTHSGLGLGLAIVRHVVELHGGSVRAESAGPGAGATFRIRLPLGTDRAAPRTEIAPPGPGHVSTLEGARVLLVDDDPDTVQMLTAALADRKAKVHAAASVAEALDAIEWYRPDVIVSDLAMPGEDGYSLIRTLRSSETGAPHDIPAVALTASARVEDRARALAAGFNMLVPKPVEPNELVGTLANLLGPGGRLAR